MDYWENVWCCEDKTQCFEFARGWENVKHPIIDVFCSRNLKQICDAACGFGAFSAMLRKNGFEVDGFDISNTSINLTKTILRDLGYTAGEYISADIRDLPYES